MKLLSFAIPCYNSAAYMEKCIKSCLAGGDDVEIIIVDDGSTKDDTLKIAKEYEAKYPKENIVLFLIQIILLSIKFAMEIQLMLI